jgi:hypothetical protein
MSFLERDAVQRGVGVNVPPELREFYQTIGPNFSHSLQRVEAKMLTLFLLITAAI